MKPVGSVKQAVNDERLSFDVLSVEDVNSAPRVFRRLPLGLLGFLVLLPLILMVT